MNIDFWIIKMDVNFKLCSETKHKWMFFSFGLGCKIFSLTKHTLLVIFDVESARHLAAQMNVNIVIKNMWSNYMTLSKLRHFVKNIQMFTLQTTLRYLVKRLYKTRSVDFKSILTMSSGLAFGFGKPTSCIRSKENATLWT